MSMSPGVDMCGRTVMVLVGRNIPVTLIDIEKVKIYIYIYIIDVRLDFICVSVSTCST